MVDRHLFVRLGGAVVAVGLLVGGFVLLTGKDEPPTANAADAVAVVGEPTSAQPPLMQPTATSPCPRRSPIARPTSGRSSTS
jgi:hypothetical protein